MVGVKIHEEEEDKVKKEPFFSFPKPRNKGMLVGLCWFVVGKSRGEFEFENGTLVLIKLGI